jgi:hypothetical protein
MRVHFENGSVLIQYSRQEVEPAIRPANSALASRISVAPGTVAGIADLPKPRTLDDVSREISDRFAGLNRYQFPVGQLRIEADRVIAGNREFRLGDEGARRICKWIGAPVDYVVALKSDLRARIFQSHLDERRFKDTKLNDSTSCIVSREGRFIDLGRSDLLTLDHATVLQSVIEGVGPDSRSLEVQGLQMDDETLTLEVVSPQLVEEVRPGDIMRAGLHVAYSQLDGEATQVLAYVHRLVCENGMTQRQCMGEQRRSTPRTRRLPNVRPEAREMQMAQIRKMVGDIWAGLGKKLEAIRRLRDKHADRSILERFLRQAHLFSNSLMDQLLDAWDQEGSEPSAFGALNALTRVATHSTRLPVWKRQRLSRLAGIYAHQDVHLCPHCFSIVAR